MGYVTREMIDRAKKMDLLTYLQTYEPQELVHFGGNTYCTREHDSLKISNGKWCWFSRGIGGKTALDYLIKVKELPFTEAVERIVGRAAERPSVFHARAQPEKPKTLLLPPKSNSNTRVIAYLKSRGIDGGLIEQCIRSGQLYESLPYHNTVFVGMDRNGTPRYACLRGIGTDFKGEATGSDKRFSFALPATGESRMLCVFESAIDLLSYATMAQAGGLSWRSQHAQNDEATRLRDFDGWKERGIYVRKNETGISILEAGDSYVTEDGRTGYYYNVKKVFDISQTDAKRQRQPQVHYDDRLLLSALIAKRPVPIEMADSVQNGAVYDYERKTIFVQRGMDGQDLFRSVSLALARAEMAQQENSTPQADAFKSYCVSYMLCRKYGVDTQGYDFSRLPDELKNAEPQTIRGELTDIRDTLQTMTGKMARTLEQSRTAAQKETGKER